MDAKRVARERKVRGTVAAATPLGSAAASLRDRILQSPVNPVYLMPQLQITPEVGFGLLRSSIRTGEILTTLSGS